jgi:hypothetical protein
MSISPDIDGARRLPPRLFLYLVCSYTAAPKYIDRKVNIAERVLVHFSENRGPRIVQQISQQSRTIRIR